MSDNYNNFRGESAFKNTVKHKQNSNNNLAWYEETKESFPIINTSHLWADYDALPEFPIENINEYKVTRGVEEVPIYKKYIEPLVPTKNPNIFYNEHFNQVIDKVGYEVKLYTKTGEEVPFGLGKWVFDNEYHLIFLDGVPEGWGTGFQVSFYRYEGRVLEEVILKKDGSTPMANAYVPKAAQDIATKGYVDERTGEAIDELKQLLPEEPTAELVGKSLENNYRILKIDTKEPVKAFEAEYVRNGIHFSKVTYDNTQIEITSPLIYLRDSGKLSLEVTYNGLPHIHTLDFANLTETNGFTIFYQNYYKDINSKYFYKGIIVQYTQPLNEMLSGDRTFEFKFSLTDLPKAEADQASSTLIIGVDKLPKTKDIFDKDSFFWFKKPTKLPYTRWVSGIQHFKVGTKVPFEGITAHPLNSYYNQDFPLGNISFKKQDEELFNLDYLPPKGGWNIFENPKVSFEGEFIVPENTYTDKLEVIADTYNVEKLQNAEWKKSYNILLDTISDESQRVVSKEFQNPETNKIYSERGEWDSHQSLVNNHELLLLNNLYQYPYQNFDKIIGVDSIFSDWDDRWLVMPDYSVCKGKRYATFKYILPTYTTGINVEIPGLKLVTDLKFFEANSVEVYLEGRGWLNGKLPYPGYGLPSKEGDPCLVVANGHDSTNYFTFGYRPYQGVIYIRVGLTEGQKDIQFKTPIVKEANPL